MNNEQMGELLKGKNVDEKVNKSHQTEMGGFFGKAEGISESEYSSIANMYEKSLNNLDDLEKNKDIYSKLVPEDRELIEKLVIYNEIGNNIDNWSAPEERVKLSKKIKYYSEKFPQSLKKAQVSILWKEQDFDPENLKEMFNISSESLRELFNETRNGKIEFVKTMQTLKTKTTNIEVDKLEAETKEEIEKINKKYDEILKQIKD